MWGDCCLDILRDKAFLVTTSYIQFSKSNLYKTILPCEQVFCEAKKAIHPPLTHWALLFTFLEDGGFLAYLMIKRIPTYEFDLLKQLRSCTIFLSNRECATIRGFSERLNEGSPHKDLVIRQVFEYHCRIGD